MATSVGVSAILHAHFTLDVIAYFELGRKRRSEKRAHIRALKNLGGRGST